MDFTYNAYSDLLVSFKEKGYSFCNYHDYESQPRCVILRHDIDESLDKAVRFAELESAMGVCSTWFVLLKTDFYNVASKASLEKLARIQALGHEIGLHFDEKAYDDTDIPVSQRIQREAKLLADILQSEITTVSMHRPSKATLEANIEIPGMVNSYGQYFFHGFKYLSDSRKRWREPVEQIVESGEYDRIHLLTHAIWYDDTQLDIEGSLRAFVSAANAERYACLKDNITDLESILPLASIITNIKH